MKKRKWLSFILVCAMLFGLFGFTYVSASGNEAAEKTQVLDYVKEFMEKRARYEWVFENNDYAQYFDTVNRSANTLAGNFAQTMKFYQDARKLVNHYIENLEIDYVIHDFQKTSQGYQVYLSEFLFYDIIDGNGMPSVYEERYVVQLAKRGENLKVTDVDIETDTFYQSVKQTGFNSTAELAKFQNALQNNGTPMTKTVDGNALMSTKANSKEFIPYNKDAAARYARIFSYATKPNEELANDDSAYYFWYNPYFGNYDGIDPNVSSGDCANFASQCLYHGFYGRTDNRSLIQNKSFPMDTVGLYEWWTTGAATSGHSTGSWAYASLLAQYPTNVANAWGEESGIIATTYTNPTSGTLSAIPATDLKGALFFTGGNQHVIIINHAAGNNLNQLYFCAHSHLRSNVQVSSVYSTISQINTIIIPQSYRVKCANHGTAGTTCANCGYSRIQMQMTTGPLAYLGDSVLLKATEINNLNVYQISGRILRYNENETNPSNVSVGSFTTVNNTNQISKSHSFTTTGLYFIEITVKEYSTSTPKIFTFPLRVLP